jgi:AcrR family transcriptional regulator
VNHKADATAERSPAPAPAQKRPGRPRKSEAQDTKAALLRAAVELFTEHGYAGTSIRAIARAVGMSESVLYAHYGSKQAIFDAATERLGPAGVLSLVAEVDDEVSGDPAAYLQQVCERSIAAWDTEEARAWMSLLSREGLIREPLTTAVDGIVGTLGEQFSAWREAGLLRPGLGEPADLVFALMAPLAQARILGLHAAATPAQRAAARDRMRRHTAFFVRAVVGGR